MQISVADPTGKVPMLAIHRYIQSEAVSAAAASPSLSLLLLLSYPTSTSRRSPESFRSSRHLARERRVASHSEACDVLRTPLSHRMQIDAPGSRRESRLYIRSILPLFPNCRARRRRGDKSRASRRYCAYLNGPHLERKSVSPSSASPRIDVYLLFEPGGGSLGSRGVGPSPLPDEVDVFGYWPGQRANGESFGLAGRICHFYRGN